VSFYIYLVLRCLESLLGGMNKQAKYIFKKPNMFRRLLGLSRFVFPNFACRNK